MTLATLCICQASVCVGGGGGGGGVGGCGWVCVSWCVRGEGVVCVCV